MEPHRVRQETAYPSLAYGLFGLGRFLPQIPDSYKRVIFMSICGSIRLSLDKNMLNLAKKFAVRKNRHKHLARGKSAIRSAVIFCPEVISVSGLRYRE